MAGCCPRRSSIACACRSAWCSRVSTCSRTFRCWTT
ncbi:Uncharacterised protein [Bordetella pertussis]|nr:Uncharacterised protein [Bordetella pertussis]